MGFPGMTGIPSCIYCLCYEYLTVHPGSALETWVMILGMYRTHLKHIQCLYRLISNNNILVTDDLYINQFQMTHLNNRYTLMFSIDLRGETLQKFEEKFKVKKMKITRILF